MKALTNEQSKPDFADAAETYITGRSWPGSPRLNVNEALMNPWTKRHWNLTQQGQIYKQDHAQAMRLAQTAGHKDPISARFENAK
jgi:hypothetical protein